MSLLRRTLRSGSSVCRFALLSGLVASTAGAWQVETPTEAQVMEADAPQSAAAAPAGDQESSSTSEGEADAPKLRDAELAPHQDALLEIAFEAATAFPIEPHIKNRSRTQEIVVRASLDLDGPLRAARYAERIDNWRRGAAFADIALWCAEHGHAEAVAEYLARADEVARGSIEGEQEWRTDRILGKVAATHLALGDAAMAARLAVGLSESEAETLASAHAKRATKEQLEVQLEAVDEIVAGGTFEQQRAMMTGLVQLYETFYASETDRERIEQAVVKGWKMLPVQVRFEALLDMGEAAVVNADGAQALDFAGRAQRMLMDHQWRAETLVPLLAGLAELRFRAGDPRTARTDAEMALTHYREQREKIVNIYRAGALRPLAEAYHAMGDAEHAAEVYALALDEGVVNPNSRPRAIDLAATCCSMAVHGFEPSEAQLERVNEIFGLLGDPW